MHCRIRTALIVVLSVLCVPVVKGQIGTKEKAKKLAVQKEIERLEGTWEVVSYTWQGKQVGIPEGKREQWAVRRGAFTPAESVGGKSRGTFKIDPEKTPKSIDISATDGALQGETALGIYELNGEELRTCIAPPGEARPVQFSAEMGGKQTIIIYRRLKPKS